MSIIKIMDTQPATEQEHVLDGITVEPALVEIIVHSLLTDGGYVEGNPVNFNKDIALDTRTLLQFIRTSQPETWEKQRAILGDNAEEKFSERILKDIDCRGSLEVLRHGIKYYNAAFKLAYFIPAEGFTPESLARYAKNILTVYRHLCYGKDNSETVTLVLSVNGIPVTTAEVAEPFSGQEAADAQKRYMHDIDPGELLFQFKKRALVHFALDGEQVFMTTQLAGKDTQFLPFNRGYNRRAGNPPNPDGFKTAYLWEEIWAKHNWLDIIAGFPYLERIKSGKKGCHEITEKPVFPRYHQWEAVCRLGVDAGETGPGKNYLVQHAEGGGHGSTIAWLAYRLYGLHNRDRFRVFDMVIVIAAGDIQARYLADTIFQLDHRKGLVEVIESDATQLAQSMVSAEPLIIITTTRMFSFVLEEIGRQPQRSYAVILDSVHAFSIDISGKTGNHNREPSPGNSPNNQTLLEVQALGEGALRRAFGPSCESLNCDSPTPYPNDQIPHSPYSMNVSTGRRRQSVFFFSAVPEPGTLEGFGVKKPGGGVEPFHLYSMRQAIEEGFLMDVTEYYTTYSTVYRLGSAARNEDGENVGNVMSAVVRVFPEPPLNLAQKVAVMVEHYRQYSMKKIGGKAKAMVVTASPTLVVRYKEEFDRYIEEREYSINVLAAFDPFSDEETGIRYTEYAVNGIEGSVLLERFAGPRVHILVTADKYRYDLREPLLHTLYIDRGLSGMEAVKTLSRLNRVYPGKGDTFVLDFVNRAEDIREAFRDYDETGMFTDHAEQASVERLYELKGRLEQSGVIWPEDLDTFCKFFFRWTIQINGTEYGIMESAVQAAVERYVELSGEEERERFKGDLREYTRLFGFLAQVMGFGDVGVERLAAYSRYMLTMLPRGGEALCLRAEDELALRYYRVQRIKEGALHLEKSTLNRSG